MPVNKAYNPIDEKLVRLDQSIHAFSSQAQEQATSIPTQPKDMKVWLSQHKPYSQLSDAELKRAIAIIRQYPNMSVWNKQYGVACDCYDELRSLEDEFYGRP
jgi:D-hexose-6-phosphate mutarotase